MTYREQAEEGQDHDINADNCRTHNEPLYCGWCKACAGEAIRRAVEESIAAGVSANNIRLAMSATGWRSHDQITDQGWGDKVGYSIWFERWDWHGKKTGNKACYHAHTDDLSKIDETTQKAAEIARRAWAEFPEKAPSILVDGTLG